MTPSAACECGAKEQTADHVVLHCPIHRSPRGMHSLTVLYDQTIRGKSKPERRSGKKIIAGTRSA